MCTISLETNSNLLNNYNVYKRKYRIVLSTITQEANNL